MDPAASPRNRPLDVETAFRIFFKLFKDEVKEAVASMGASTPEPLLTGPEACKALGIGRDVFRRLVKEKRIVGIQVTPGQRGLRFDVAAARAQLGGAR